MIGDCGDLLVYRRTVGGMVPVCEVPREWTLRWGGDGWWLELPPLGLSVGPIRDGGPGDEPDFEPDDEHGDLTVDDDLGWLPAAVLAFVVGLTFLAAALTVWGVTL